MPELPAQVQSGDEVQEGRIARKSIFGVFCPEIGSFNNETEQSIKRDKRMDKKDVFREKLKNGDAKPVERLLVRYVDAYAEEIAASEGMELACQSFLHGFDAGANLCAAIAETTGKAVEKKLEGNDGAMAAKFVGAVMAELRRQLDAVIVHKDPGISVEAEAVFLVSGPEGADMPS